MSACRLWRRVTVLSFAQKPPPLQSSKIFPCCLCCLDDDAHRKAEHFCFSVLPPSTATVIRISFSPISAHSSSISSGIHPFPLSPTLLRSGDINLSLASSSECRPLRQWHVSNHAVVAPSTPKDLQIRIRTPLNFRHPRTTCVLFCLLDTPPVFCISSDPVHLLS